MDIEIKDLSYRHPGAAVDTLDGINLKFSSGSFTAITGASGCGKTTLLRLIAGLIQPSHGEIGFKNSDSSIPTTSNSQVAWHPQGDLLLTWKRTLNNVTLGARICGTEKKVAERQAHELLETFGIADTANKWPAQLSGGMRQRASLLRTFLMPKPVLALDEPFSSLDTPTRNDLRSWLESVWTADKRTTIMVTHDLREALLLANQVVVMSQDGTISHIEQSTWERPRTSKTQSEPRFIKTVSQLEDMIESTSTYRNR